MFSLGERPQVRMVPGDAIYTSYTMIPQKYYHPNVSRNALGLVGGNDVSLISGNLVDLESDLWGVTRTLSRCSSKKYQPTCALGGGKAAMSGPAGPSPLSGTGCPSWPGAIVFQERATGAVVTVNTSPRHLPTTQYVSYPGVPAPEPMVQEVYGAPWRF